MSAGVDLEAVSADFANFRAVDRVSVSIKPGGIAFAGALRSPWRSKTSTRFSRRPTSTPRTGRAEAQTMRAPPT